LDKALCDNLLSLAWWLRKSNKLPVTGEEKSNNQLDNLKIGNPEAGENESEM